MQNKYFKKYKLNKLQIIKKIYKYIYIFRYDDLTVAEIIFIKKKLKKLNYKLLILNKNLIKINNIFEVNIKGQGSLLIIYGNNNLNLINFLKFKKINLIFLIFRNNIYSNLKLNKIIFNSHIFPLNILLIKPFLNFLYSLRKI